MRIRPNADDFVKDLRRQLASKPDPGFTVKVHADLRPAERELRSWRARESRNDVSARLNPQTAQASQAMRVWRQREERHRLRPNVSPDTVAASAKLAGWRQTEQRHQIRQDVQANTAGAAAEVELMRRLLESKRITLKVGADTKALRQQSSSYQRGRILEGLVRSDTFKANIFVGLLAAAQPAVTALTQVAAGLQQVAQSALVVPGAIAGVAASFGTLAIGLSGVSDAYKAVSKAALSAGDDQADQARAAVAAQNSLRNAVVDESRARKDQARAYRDARNELRDLNIEMRGGLISESRAILEAQQAKEELARGDFTDIREQLLRVAETEQRLIEVRARNADTAQKLTDAQTKGIEGSDQVVDANERLLRTQQQVAEAQLAAADASSKQSAAQKAAAQAMDRLSPSAQEFVRTLQRMQPMWDAFTDSAQEPLFEGKAREFEQFVNTMAPMAQTGMSRIAAAWNDNITALFTSLGSDRGRSLIERILGNTGEAQEILSKAIDPLVRAVGTLAAAGSDKLPRLATALGDVAERFTRFIEAADKDGRLDKWISDGLDGLTSLGRAVLNIGQSFTAITRAAGGGGAFLGWLERATGKMNDFLNSTDGQKKLKDFFDEGKRRLDQWLPVLQKLPGAFEGIYNAAKRWADWMIPVLDHIFTALERNKGAVEALGLMFLTWKALDGIASLMKALTGVGTMLSTTLPASAATGASGINNALRMIVVPAIGVELAQQLQDAIDSNPTLAKLNHFATPDQWAKWLREKIFGTDKAVFQDDPPQGRAGAVPPSAPNSANPPTVGGIPIPGLQRLPPKALGGPLPSGRGPGPTGGWPIEAHGDEWVLPAHARRTVGDSALWALTRGRSFAPGGLVDEFGNPITAGPAPGPMAPNPMGGNTSGSGGGILANIMRGATGSLGHMIGLGSTLLGTTGQSGTGQDSGFFPKLGPMDAGSIANRAASIPGLIGLFGSMNSSNPQQALTNWGSQTAEWLGGFASKMLGGFGSTLWSGALSMVGLENSILSPSNKWTQAGMRGAQFALGQDGPVGTLLGIGGNKNYDTTGLVDPMSLAQQYNVNIDHGMLSSIASGKGLAATTDVPAASGNPATAANTGIKAITSGVLTALPSRGGEGRLQINTINAKRAIEAAFPTIKEIGGYRQDSKKWHPSGLAIDVMIPGGTTRGGANPSGKFLGDRIYAFVMANKAALGVDYVLWQTDEGGDHYNHLHVNTTGGGYPEPMAAGGPTPSRRGPGPTGGYLAEVHPGEFMISARGRATVPDSFLHALNKGEIRGLAIGGEAVPPKPPRPPIPYKPFETLPVPRKTFEKLPTTPPPTPVAPRSVAPSAPVAPTTPVAPPPPAPTAPAAPTESVPAATPSSTPPQAMVPIGEAPTDLNHNIAWLNTAITSTATTIGNLIQSAASMGGGAGGGAAAAGGSMGAGLAAQFAAQYAGGLVQQGGKIVSDAANVVSSFLVGSVPGSMGDIGAPASGVVLRAEQNRPSLAPYGSPFGGGNQYTFNGYDAREVFQMAQNQEALERQAVLATARG